ncbi:MAG TPA: hypothetical protein VFZ53_23115 [Polyangiaceae bacterium]
MAAEIEVDLPDPEADAKKSWYLRIGHGFFQSLGFALGAAAVGAWPRSPNLALVLGMFGFFSLMLWNWRERLHKLEADKRHLDLVALGTYDRRQAKRRARARKRG